jgi:hypothetical protein
MRGMYKSVINLQLGGSAWRGKGGEGGEGVEWAEWAVEGHVVGWWVDSNIFGLPHKEKEEYKNRKTKKR